MKKNINKLFSSNDLQGILSSFSVEEVVNVLKFRDSIKLTWRMLFDDYDNFEQSEYGVNLLVTLKKFKNDDWSQDWRNDALLGVACDNTYRYDERYSSFKKAYENAVIVGEGDHPGLLISLAGCCHSPGKPLISYEDSLRLVLRAIRDKTYLDGAWALSGIYSSIGDDESHKKWKSLAEKLEFEKGEISPHIYPQFLWDEEIASK